MAGQKIGDAFIQISGQFDKLNKGLKQTTSKIDKGFSGVTKKLDGQFNNLGKTLVTAFAVEKIASFSAEAVKLAGVAEGVERAFKRLDDPMLLNNLKEATRGTVSELDLMKQAVQAKNLGVPIKNLASLFEFATQRAADTGLEVDYLVESLVTGIGKKSTMVLDNLGISAIDLRTALGGVSTEMATVADFADAVGKIGKKSIQGIGNTALTSAQNLAQMTAEIENLKVEIGKGLMPVMKTLLTFTRDVALGFKILFTSATTESENFKKNIEKGFDPQTLAEARMLFKEIKDQIKGQSGGETALRGLLKKNNVIIKKRLAFAETFTGESKRLALEEAARLTALNNMVELYLEKLNISRKETKELEKQSKLQESSVKDIAPRGIPQVGGVGALGGGATLSTTTAEGLQPLIDKTNELSEAQMIGAGIAMDFGFALQDSLQGALEGSGNFFMSMFKYLAELAVKLGIAVAAAFALKAILGGITGGASILSNLGGFQGLVGQLFGSGSGALNLTGGISGRNIELSNSRTRQFNTRTTGVN